MLTGLQLLTLKLPDPVGEATPPAAWCPELELPDISAVLSLQRLPGLHEDVARFAAPADEAVTLLKTSARPADSPRPLRPLRPQTKQSRR